MDRIILHSDINACYAGIELLFAPQLRGKPVAVGGDEALRHGIVLSKTEEAKRIGVRTGMTLWQARQLCPELVVVPPHFDRYLYFTGEVQKIYSEYTDRREPFGIDESWLDLTGCVPAAGGKAAAKEIGARVKHELGLTVSVGVSWNKVFAKLGSDYKKPDAVTVIGRHDYKDKVWPLPAGALLFVGRSTARRLGELGIHTIGDLARTQADVLRLRLGKAGDMLQAFANGWDTSPVRRAGERPPVKSIGNSTTTPRDMISLSDAMPALVSLAESVGARLRQAGLMARTVTLDMRSAQLTWCSHRMRLECPTDCSRALLESALALLAEAHAWPGALRGIGIRAEELVSVNMPDQIDIFNDYVNRIKQKNLDSAIDRIRGKYGGAAVQRGAVFADPAMAVTPAQEEFAFVKTAQ
ncbi:MAG TPA: DNA polymerase IV [Clostridiales bacterium]|nr:DNA polymerase IV [Clostridiales bacterium]